MNPPSDAREQARAAITAVAADLLREHGSAAVTTRAVTELAGVQAPTLYRLFGDKDGLLEAVAEHVLAEHVASKRGDVAAAAADDTDPVADLVAGWRRQIEFGLANPDVFRLLGDPTRAHSSQATATGRGVLAARVHRVALAGRLRVTESRAVDLVHAAGVGVVQALLEVPADRRDPGLAEAMLETLLTGILTRDLVDNPVDNPVDSLVDEDAGTPGDVDDPVATAAVTLRAAAADLQALTPGERALLVEWLGRVTPA
ncbi:TetR family transcriptional regulator [Terracoccus luteus]|uniref:TetR family transcriptional regulator n=1 Tax=Terracoccus luteus TaxID=53356 RepID=A0A495Y4R3_9MICO|nr:TetR/AcrR family transcriptional regulator [Terracoccus luteus]RKT79748.1 TetR family transcriptional regulator [Terracoccus luteus]